MPVKIYNRGKFLLFSGLSPSKYQSFRSGSAQNKKGMDFGFLTVVLPIFSRGHPAYQNYSRLDISKCSWMVKVFIIHKMLSLKSSNTLLPKPNVKFLSRRNMDDVLHHFLRNCS